MALPLQCWQLARPMPATLVYSIANSGTFLTVLRKGIEKSAGEASQPVQIEIAEDDVQKQLSQIQNFIAAKVDAIIVNAVDTSATAPMTKLASDAGIPIVYVNRQPIDVDELGPKGAFVASDEVDSGTLEGKECVACSAAKATYLSCRGISPPTLRFSEPRIFMM